MEYRPLVSALMLCCSQAHADMQPLTDADLSSHTAQTGIGIDIDLSARIGEFTYVDSDGVNGGSQGRFTIEDIRLGAITDFNDTTLGSVDPVRFGPIGINVDGSEGVVFTLGDYTGLDIDTGRILINNGLVGSIEIENHGNQVPRSLLEFSNAQFGTGYDLSSVGAQFSGSDRVAIQAGGGDGSSGLTLDISLFEYTERFAYVDDGNQIALTDVFLFNDESGLPGGFQFNGLTVDVIDRNGQGRLVIDNIDARGSLLIGNISIGDPDIANTSIENRANSIGSLLLRDIQLVDTRLEIYAQ